jgi:hypothetical protein
MLSRWRRRGDVRQTADIDTGDPADVRRADNDGGAPESSAYQALVGRWANPVQVTLIGKPGCHLCEQARAVIAGVVESLDVPFEEVDVSAFPELRERYWDQIPVTLVGGKPVDFYTIDPQRLRAALGNVMRKS